MNITNMYVGSSSQIAGFLTNLSGMGGTGSDGAFASSGNATQTGTNRYTSFLVSNGHTITCGDSSNKLRHIQVTGDMTIASGGALVCGSTGNGGAANTNGGAGWTTMGTAPGTSVGSSANGGSGGASLFAAGGNSGGGSAGATRGTNSGTALTVFSDMTAFLRSDIYNLGSGGGGGSNAGGSSACMLIIDVLGNLTVNGSLTGNGVAGAAGATGAGGGPGAIIVIRVKGNADFTGSTVTANGGVGGNGTTTHGGGGGAGGAILIGVGGVYTAPSTLTATGGTGGSKTGAGTIGANGGDGVTYLVNNV